MAVVLVMTELELEAAVARAVEPLRREVAQLRAELEAEVRLVTIAEAARTLGVSVRTVKRRLKAGELPSVGSGIGRRVDLSRVLPRDG
jgi:excisionase family DNA binding protein